MIKHNYEPNNVDRNCKLCGFPRYKHKIICIQCKKVELKEFEIGDDNDTCSGCRMENIQKKNGVTNFRN
jgi:hypothetical protein